jgi:hypothetical protein
MALGHPHSTPHFSLPFEFPLSTLWSTSVCDPLSSASAALCIADTLLLFASIPLFQVPLPWTDDLQLRILFTLGAHLVDVKLFHYLPPDHRRTKDPTDTGLLNLLFLFFLPWYVTIRFGFGIASLYPASLDVDEAVPLLRSTSSTVDRRGRRPSLKEWFGLVYMVLAMTPMTIYVVAFLCWVLSVIVSQILWCLEAAWDWS